MPLVVFEGLDASGKSAVMKKFLEKKPDYSVIDFPTEEFPQLREFLEGRKELKPKALTLLFLADFCQKEEEMKKGKVALERYFYSTVAYEGALLGFSFVSDLVVALDLPEPDVVFLLDAEPEVLLSRIQPNEVFQRAGFLEKVRENYLRMASACFLAKKWVVLDARADLEELAEKILSEVELVEG